MAQSFSAAVGDWVHRVEGALEVVFQESAQELARQLDIELVRMVYEGPPAASGYSRTGFLRASFVASTSAMPQLTRDNPGASVPADLGDVMLVIEGLEAGQTLYLGMTANYAAHVHYGANGQQPRPWMTLVAQRWSEIVSTKAAEVKSRLGL